MNSKIKGIENKLLQKDDVIIAHKMEIKKLNNMMSENNYSYSNKDKDMEYHK